MKVAIGDVTPAGAAGILTYAVGTGDAGDGHRRHLGALEAITTGPSPGTSRTTSRGHLGSFQQALDHHGPVSLIPGDLHHRPWTCEPVFRGGNVASLLSFFAQVGDGPGTERPDVSRHFAVGGSRGQGGIQREGAAHHHCCSGSDARAASIRASKPLHGSRTSVLASIGTFAIGLHCPPGIFDDTAGLCGIGRGSPALGTLTKISFVVAHVLVPLLVVATFFTA